MSKYKDYGFRELIERVCELQDEIGVDELKYYGESELIEMIEELEN